MNLNRFALPPRYLSLLWVVLIFLLINTFTRLGLMIFEQDSSLFQPTTFLKIFTVGGAYDVVVASYVILPFVFLALIIGNSNLLRRLYATLAFILLAIALFNFLFTALAEGTFWNEFASRFNFIAVDYLVYTREVLGNIWQSYPVGWLLTGLAVVALTLLWLIRKPFWRMASADGGKFSTRLVWTIVFVAMTLVLTSLSSERWRDSFAQPAARELASNGYYEFSRAFKANDLDYFRFYATLPPAEAKQRLQAEIQRGEPNTQFVAAALPTTRHITPDQSPSNKHVVLISIESLGADYVQAFGGKSGLTPNLDRLAQQGLNFQQLYATGLRTVRGLEAITLSIPPTPGHAVPVRKHNTGLQSLGSVLKANGYHPNYIYGGYSYFDNMENFFTGNGYTVTDRTQVADENIHHETIWGIADEDILHHAIGVISQQAAQGEKVFAHIMTTSNHRPYTYPAGRIDIPSGSGRDGAVKYTDWAIGQFLQEAEQQPWFKETVFVFVADHTSHGRGRTDLPPEHYRIPLIIWSPNFIQPQTITALASQIDVAPTVLGLLNIPYTSEFFGQDILKAASNHPRAFMANYLTVGYLEQNKVVELMPKQSSQVVDAQTGTSLPTSAANTDLIKDVIAYYQTAAEALKQLP